MELKTTLEIFNPLDYSKTIHIIGCGATGSNVAIQLARMGVEKFDLWDYDTIESHNLTNQVFYLENVGQTKVQTLTKILKDINQSVTVHAHGKWEYDSVKGLVIVAVDSIETRHAIYQTNYDNSDIDLIIDPRLGTTTYAIYAYKWTPENKEKLLKSTDFKDSDMVIERSACGTPLNIGSTVVSATANIIQIIINFVNNKAYPSTIHSDVANFKIAFLNI